MLNQELEFIGQKYLMETTEQTEAKKQEILQSYDQFQLDKIAWLNNTYDDESTKKPFWSVYNNNIHDYEVAKNKDLKDFTRDEAISMMKSFIYAMPATIGTIKAFVNRYFDYWAEKGEITINPLLGEESLKGFKASKKLLETKLYDMNDFYELLYKMKETEAITLANLKPLLLARYGIVGKEAIYMRQLKYSDIDIVNKFVNIYDESGEFISLLPIDNRFIDFLAELDGVVEEESKQSLYNSDAYVLEARQILNYNTVNSRVYTAFKLLNKWGKENVENWEDVGRISFNKLVFTRQIELLLQIRKSRRLTSVDMESIMILMNDATTSLSVIYQLQNKYVGLTKDEVIEKRLGRKKESRKILELSMIDPVAEETVKNICESIGISID